MKKNFELMARYNQWMNSQVYRASATLSAAQLAEDRGAFFGSILGTLNHILVGDTIWLKRFAEHPARFPSLDSLRSIAGPKSLSECIYSNFDELQLARTKMDQAIVRFSIEATDTDYQHELEYRNTRGKPFKDGFAFLVQHFFNHQTHHRGQTTTLLSQLGIDVGATDLLEIIRET